MADRKSRFVDERREPPEQHEYEGIGAVLRRSRERLGLDLADVAAALKIQQVHLDALERGRFHELPGPAYAVGFVRSYARYLRLDDAAAVAQFKSETAIAPGPRRLVAPEPIGEARRPRGLLIGLSLLLAGAVYGGWMWLQGRNQVDLELIPPPPQTAGVAAELAPSAPAASPATPATAAAAPSAETPASAAEAQAPAQTADAGASSTDPMPQDSAAATQDPAASAAEEEEESTPPPTPISPVTEPPTLAAAMASAPAGAQVYGLENRDARVMLRAKADSWVRIRGAGNEVVLERTLRTGDTFLVPNRPDLTLWTGNAGGLEVLVDGKPLPPLGAPGAPRRDISLDPDRLLGGG